MKFVLAILALLVATVAAQAGHPVVVQRVRATPFRPNVGRVVVQRQVVVGHRAAFVAPIHAQQFVAPVYQQQFVAPVYGVQQFVAPQAVVGGCSALYR